MKIRRQTIVSSRTSHVIKRKTSKESSITNTFLGDELSYVEVFDRELSGPAIVESIIQEQLNECGQIIYEKYINPKIKPYVAKHTLEMLKIPTEVSLNKI